LKTKGLAPVERLAHDLAAVVDAHQSGRTGGASRRQDRPSGTVSAGLGRRATGSPDQCPQCLVELENARSRSKRLGFEISIEKPVPEFGMIPRDCPFLKAANRAAKKKAPEGAF